MPAIIDTKYSDIVFVLAQWLSFLLSFPSFAKYVLSFFFFLFSSPLAPKTLVILFSHRFNHPGFVAASVVGFLSEICTVRFAFPYRPPPSASRRPSQRALTGRGYGNR